MMTQLRYVAFVRVAYSPEEKCDLFSIADIIEPLPQYATSLLRSARLTAGPEGYVLVGDAEKPFETYRRVSGLYSRPRPSRFRAAQLAPLEARGHNFHSMQEGV